MDPLYPAAHAFESRCYTLFMFMEKADSVRDFLSNSAPIIAAFNTFCRKHNLGTFAAADHLGFRCGSHATFLKVHAVFTEESTYIYQSIISGRPIAIIKLKHPLETLAGPLWFVELADQKPDGSQTEGFDHIEIVPIEMACGALKAKLETKGERVEQKIRPHHTTYDVQLAGLVVRLEEEPLIQKVKRAEMI